MFKTYFVLSLSFVTVFAACNPTDTAMEVMETRPSDETIEEMGGNPEDFSDVDANLDGGDLDENPIEAMEGEVMEEEVMEDNAVEAELPSDNEAMENEVMEVEESAPALQKAPFSDFNESEYDSAVSEGKAVFVDFHATWCPTCRVNAPRIEEAFSELGDLDLVGFRADYDTEDDLKKELSVFAQSSLVLVKDGEIHRLGPAIVTKEQIVDFIREHAS